MLGLPDEKQWQLLATICITRKYNCYPKLTSFLPTHLLCCKALVRWSKCKKSTLIEIPPVLLWIWGKDFSQMHLLSLNCHNINWSGFPMPPILFDFISVQYLSHTLTATVKNICFTEWMDPAIAGKTLIQRNIKSLFKPLSSLNQH